MPEIPQVRQAVIYRDPADAPGMWVVRGWTVSRQGSVADREMFVCHALDTARLWAQQLVPGGFSLPRFPEDDPAIFEVWI